MPNQRKANKKLVSAFVDETLKAEIDKLPESQTVLVEIWVVRGLLKDRAITKEQLREMATQGKLQEDTVKALRADKIL